MDGGSETVSTREPAAIMFSDIAGYSTIMGRDEHTARHRAQDRRSRGKLLTTIDEVGPLTAACLIAELGDRRGFAALARLRAMSAPRLRQSGKKRFSGSPTIPFGNCPPQKLGRGLKRGKLQPNLKGEDVKSKDVGRHEFRPAWA
jgi:hypothetical protein